MCQYAHAIWLTSPRGAAWLRQANTAEKFNGKTPMEQVYIRRDPLTGDIVLSSRSTYWAGFFAARKAADVPADFLCAAERFQNDQLRDPLEGFDE